MAKKKCQYRELKALFPRSTKKISNMWIKFAPHGAPLEVFTNRKGEDLHLKGEEDVQVFRDQSPLFDRLVGAAWELEHYRSENGIIYRPRRVLEKTYEKARRARDFNKR